MRREAISCGFFLLLAGCGGTQGAQQTAPPGESAAASGSSAQESDPRRVAREAFTNPGGMWMPRQMGLPQHVERLRALGVTVPPDNLTNPLAEPLHAVVSLGGCTGSFVSPDGLVVTNHHCVQGALQLNATPDKNLVERGFLAARREDELPAGPAQRISVAQSFRDVTKEMRDGLEALGDPLARKREVERRTKQLVSGCEAGRPGLRCEVVSFFRGAEYQLIEYLELRDVRLVYAPPRSIGNFGGEIDNWAWPRHTGDFSFYRAYVGKDGAPADPSPENVPFRPAHFLKLDRDGIGERDFVMVAGYPGRTQRITTYAEVMHDVDWTYPYSIALYEARYSLLEGMLKPDSGISPEARIKAAVLKQRVQNGLEKTSGVLAGLKKDDMLAQKKAVDERVRAFAARPENAQLAAALAKLDVLIAALQKTARVDFDRDRVLTGSTHLTNAVAFVRLAEERQKPDAERKPGYQERDMPRLTGAQKQLTRTFDATLDRALFRLVLVRALALPEAERPWLRTALGLKPRAPLDEAAIDRALDALYGGTQLADEATRLGLLKEATPAQLKASKDPFIQRAVALWPLIKQQEQRDDARAGEALLLMPRYAEAMIGALDGFVAPDANGTLRVTYGTVRPLEAGQRPFTVLSEIYAKNRGEPPFDAPASELAAIRERRFGPYVDPMLGEVPVDFLADLDITGGNSGSPALDAQGNLVGLAFDGNIEGVASDVVFNPKTTRTILVDARYMLWVMDALDGADLLLQELGFAPRL